MASIFYQTIMFLLFCSTWGITFLATWINHESVYKAVCVASILWSTFLFALTEGLSHFKAITSSNLLIAWGIFLILIGGYCVMKKNLLREKIKILTQKVTPPPQQDIKYLLIFIAFIIIGRTLIALITAVPNDSDVMTYHLARIGYWIQHQSVNYFDTCDLRHLHAPVLAEYINLNVLLITDSDLFANMLQIFSAHGCLILLYGIIRKLGCGVKWALFACLLALSMNAMAADSIMAEVDVVAAFYLMVLTYLMIEVLYQSKLTIFQFILLGLVSGFLYITKTNACGPAATIIIGVAIIKIFQGNFRIIQLGIISLMCIMLIVYPTFYRNYEYFDGDFMVKFRVSALAIGTSSPKYVFMNIIKNFIHLGFERNTQLINEGLGFLTRMLDVNINAPEIACFSAPFRFSYSLSFAGAGAAHLVTPLFFIATFVSVIYLVKRRTKTDGLMFTLILQMFAIMISLRWQPYGGGLMTPACVVVIIPIVYYFREITNKFSKDSWKRKVATFFVFYFIFESGVSAAEHLAYYSSLTLRNMKYSRYVQNFGGPSNSDFFRAYDKFSQLLDAGDYANIGIDGTWRVYHHPILAKYVPQGKKVECVRLLGNGRNTKSLNPNFEPDIILVHDIKLDTNKTYSCNGNNYTCIYNLTNSNIHYSIWTKNSRKIFVN